MASIIKRGDRWLARLRVAVVDGGPKAQSFSSKALAKQWAIEREAAQSNQKQDVLVPQSLEEALNRYIKEVCPKKAGCKWETNRLEALKTQLPIKKLITEINEPILAAWRDKRLKAVSAGTVLREISLLSAFFSQCRLREWGYLERNPLAEVSKPPEPEGRDHLYTWSELRVLLREMKNEEARGVGMARRIRFAFLFAMRTGMRTGELCKLTPAMVRKDHLALPARITKTRVARLVPLSNRAQRILKDARVESESVWFGLKAGTKDAMFRDFKGDCGLDDVQFHDTRHWAATHLARKLNPFELCKMFGWKDMSQALVYYNEHVEVTARKLN